MAPFRSIRRLLLRFVRLDNLSRLLLVEAVCGLLAARIALIFTPFPRLAERFGTLVSPTDPRIRNVLSDTDPNQVVIAADVGWAVTRAARYAPFRAVCLPQAIAAHRMLRRRGVASVMHFGAARRQTKTLDAHAWLDAAGVEVTGYPVEQWLAEVACFV